MTQRPAEPYELVSSHVSREEFARLASQVQQIHRLLIALVADIPPYLKRRFVDSAAPLQGSTLGWDNSRKMFRAITRLLLADGVTAPAAVTGEGQIYIDSADGDLKIIFGDAVVKTIVVDT